MKRTNQEGIMFNYYSRIASLAREMEMDGRKEKAEWMRLILKSENRCIFCGCDLKCKLDEEYEDKKYCFVCSTLCEKNSI